MVFLSLFVGGYCLGSGVHSYIRYKNIRKNCLDGQNQLSVIADKVEAIEFFGYKQSFNHPVYIAPSDSTSTGIPLGGGVSEKEVKLFSKVGWFLNHQIIDRDGGVTGYINNQKSLLEKLSKYNISETEFPISFPMKVIEYNFDGGVYLLDKIASANQQKIALHYALKKRYPLTILTFIFAFIPLAILDYAEFRDQIRSRRRKYGDWGFSETE